MSETTQFQMFFQGLVKPIINQAVEEAIAKALSGSSLVSPPPPADDFLSVKEAAEFLNVAPQTIYQNVKRIRHSKRMGKLHFRRSDLVDFIENGTPKC